MTSPRKPKDPPRRPVSLREVRRRKGLLLKDAAEQAGVSVKVLRAAEKGTRPMDDNAAKLAALYGLDPLVQWPEPVQA